MFQVAELDSVLEQACRSGATVRQMRDMGAHGRVATLQDPAGTLFQILELKR